MVVWISVEWANPAWKVVSVKTQTGRVIYESRTMTQILESAQTFILSNARLLERHLFAYLFQGGDRQKALTALLAYQNEDGGFGNALEPDKRTKTSQPID
jgi:hypothetical protein